jgi:hypothetical protein
VEIGGAPAGDDDAAVRGAGRSTDVPRGYTSLFTLEDAVAGVLSACVADHNEHCVSLRSHTPIGKV